MRLKILSRLDVEAGDAEGADAVISIRSAHTTSRRQLDLALAQATRNESARLLKLHFDDIGLARYGRHVGPTMCQIDEAIAFGRRVTTGRDFFDGPISHAPRLVVQCEHGRSRAAAIALVILADFLGDGREQDAVNIILRSDVEGRMQPNPLVINLADASLFRYGRIDEALSSLSPNYRVWRKHWQDIKSDLNFKDTSTR